MVTIKSAAIAALLFAPALAFADTVVVEPDVDTWVMEQPDTSVDVEGDVVVGGSLPDSVKILEVPKHDKYGYVVINKKRVIVDRSTHKIIKVY